MHTDRVVVVTGAASGIGLGTAEVFARSGHPVAMLDVQGEALEKESERLRNEGARVFARQLDVTDRTDVESCYAEIRKELGPILIVVANAGITDSVDFADIGIDRWKRMIDINLTGVFHTIQPAIEDMIAAEWGRIITISSHAAQSGAQDRAHYAASKGGVISLTKSLAREYAAKGITANTVPPSVVHTPMADEGVRNGTFPAMEVIAQAIPIPRPGTPFDIAYACEFLASEKASYITGQELAVNGGMYI